MNIHYEIFLKLVPIYERTSKYIDINSVTKLTFSEELCYMILSSCHFRVGHQLDKLLYNDEFCIFCIYSNVNNVRKSVSRYLTLEKDIEKEALILLKDIYDSSNDVCVMINKNYERTESDGHKIVENTAVDCITVGDLQRLKNLLDDDINDDDEDGDVRI